MEHTDQQQQQMVFSSQSLAPESARSTAGKPRSREVESRYRQARATPAAQQAAPGLSLQGRHDLAACNSTGWVELQLPSYAAVMIPTGSVDSGPASALFTQTSKARQMQTLATPAPGTTRRAVHKHGLEQQQRRELNRQRQLQLQKQQISCSHAITPGSASTQASSQLQQPLLHDAGTLPDTGRKASGGGMPTGVPPLPPHTAVALISPGSSRSSTSCSVRPAFDGFDTELGVRQPGLSELCTPQVSRLGASMFVGPKTAVQTHRLGMSAAMSGLAGQNRTAVKAAEDRRKMLEHYKQQKKLEAQQIAQRNAARGNQGGFKAPQPKPGTRGSAQTMGPTVSASHSVSRTAVTTAGSSVLSNKSAPTDSSSSPSQFTATMSILGSGSKPSRPGSGSRAAKPQIPKLQMDKVQQAAAITPAHNHRQQQQQQQYQGNQSPFAAGSCSKIPQYSSGGVHQEAVTPPLSSRAVSSAAHVPLPDATPRGIRDAPPSKLPKTPRGETVPTRGVSDDDVGAQPTRPIVPGLRLGGILGSESSQTAAPPPTAHAPASSRHSGGGDTGTPLAAAGKAASSHGLLAAAAKAAATPPSARKVTNVTSGCQNSRYNSSAPVQQYHQPELSRILKTPRVLPTPRATTEGAAAAKRSDQERIEDTRQQLRLLRNQNLQLRHLAARVELAVQQKRDKAATALAAAAAAIVDLYGQMGDVQKELQQEQWRSELSQVLQRQLPQIRKWNSMQIQNKSDVRQLQHACSAALSHVPLLNGAALGQLPEKPDLELLQQKLMHGMQQLQEVQPALQKLLGPDLLAAQVSNTTAAAAEKQSAQAYSSRQWEVRNSVRATAGLAEQLMGVAAEECSLLNELAHQVDRLADLHLYANSMDVQLIQKREAKAAN